MSLSQNRLGTNGGIATKMQNNELILNNAYGSWGNQTQFSVGLQSPRHPIVAKLLFFLERRFHFDGRRFRAAGGAPVV
jgi:hypothetical protein